MRTVLDKGNIKVLAKGASAFVVYGGVRVKVRNLICAFDVANQLNASAQQ